jgi:pyridoxamine 5'-phosphate oxidase
VAVTIPVKATVDLAALRRTYLLHGLSESDLAHDPITQFHHWLADAVKFGLPEPNAMALATADAAGRPAVRHVLLKGCDERGFVFYTNVGSRKAQHLAANPWAALAFPWFPMERQVLVTGQVERVSRDETLTYWRTRPRESQLGAWASPQSTVVESRAVLEERLREVSQRYPGDVPLPDFWGGYRVVPETVEFWQGRVGRLHDRFRYRRLNEEWVRERLAP